jgi:hypothetical protein
MASVSEIVDVASVWAGHRVGFALVTHGQDQYVGYYDEHRRMTFVQRKLGQSLWRRCRPDIVDPHKTDRDGRTPTHVGWDSHNFISMAVDPAGHLHASGNMHVHPLVYFRATRPGDVMSLEFFPHMVGDHEKHVTYPRFMTAPDGRLVFTYRDGSSGNGRDIYNIYDTAAQRWTRLLDQPLLDGEGKCNAYPAGPVRGPDGYYHLIWMWRDTPNAATNHDFSYARSRDLLNWEDGSGKPLDLPITMGHGEIIDPVPARHGLLNSNQRLSFDSKGRIVVSYHKDVGKPKATQLFNARRDPGGWKIVQASDWTYHWHFSGGGTLYDEITISGVTPVGGGKLVQTFTHEKHGDGGWYLDEETLQRVGDYTPEPPLPPELMRVESNYPGMRVNVLRRGNYALRWETLPPHRDQPVEGPLPPPSTLRVIKLA